MATTRIISMHVSHGTTIADCLTDRIDYSKNPDKKMCIRDSLCDLPLYDGQTISRSP